MLKSVPQFGKCAMLVVGEGTKNLNRLLGNPVMKIIKHQHPVLSQCLLMSPHYLPFMLISDRSTEKAKIFITYFKCYFILNPSRNNTFYKYRRLLYSVTLFNKCTSHIRKSGYFTDHIVVIIKKKKNACINICIHLVVYNASC